MELSIALKSIKPIHNKDGTFSISKKSMVVVDVHSGEEVSEITGLLWCDKELLLSGDNPIMTEEYFSGDPEDASYGVLIFRCDEAINI